MNFRGRINRFAEIDVPLANRIMEEMRLSQYCMMKLNTLFLFPKESNEVIVLFLNEYNNVTSIKRIAIL
jgi:hypothetical protein